MKLIADSHLDLAWNAIQMNRDLTLSLAELNALEATSDDAPGRGRAAVSLPAMRAGGVHFCVGTLVAGASAHGGAQRFNFAGVDIANSLALAQWNYYMRLAHRGEMRPIRTAAELSSHIAIWSAATEERRATLPVGIILAFEGCDAISEPAEADAWYNRGVRCASLVHYGEGRYAGGTGTTSPVTPLGRELLVEFTRLGILLDVTHLSDRAFDETIGMFAGPVFASHQNCRALVPGGRQFTDAQLKAVIERGGVVGVACDAWMLTPDWPTQSSGKPRPPRSTVPMTTLADHIDRICQLAGNAHLAAIGSDLDGGYGTEQTSDGLDSIADLQQLDGILGRRGYANEDIDAILAGNWIRYFQQHLPNPG
ncbi:MAG: membrane dipeptidase [Pirellulales bacterium]